MLDYPEALDNLHPDIVLQMLQAGADVQAVTAQVRPAGMPCICALCQVYEDMTIRPHMQLLHMHVQHLQ